MVMLDLGVSELKHDEKLQLTENLDDIVRDFGAYANALEKVIKFSCAINLTSI